MRIIKIILSGSTEARNHAKSILENHPSIRRVDVLENGIILRLLLSKPIRSEEIVEALAFIGLISIHIESQNNKGSISAALSP